MVKAINGWTKFICQNGWTKAEMKRRIMDQMQDHRSVRADGQRCMYRAEDGNKCAAGVFIPDELYTLDMDRAHLNAIDYIMKTQSKLRSLMPLDTDGMRALQELHDREINAGSANGIIAMVDPRPLICAWIDTHVED